MKILLINKFYYQRGGAESVFFETKRLLEARGHEVIVFSMLDEHNEATPYSKYFVRNIDFRKRENFWRQIYKFGRSIYSVEARRNLERLIRDTQPDVAHIHNFFHQLTPSILTALRKNNIPIVQTLHDFQLICPNYHLYTEGAPCERCKKKCYFQAVRHRCLHGSWMSSLAASIEFYLLWLFRSYREKVDLFIAPSMFLQNKIYEWGVDVETAVVPNSIVLDKYEPQFTPGDYMCCVSRLISGKGVDVLLLAMKNFPDIKLKIVGTGPELESYVDFCKRQKLSNVEFLGFQEPAQVREIIRGSRLTVMPSALNENSPMVIIESLALGKPVIASAVGGVPEIIINNHTGWLFEPNHVEELKEKIAKIFPDVQLIESAGRAGREQVVREHNADFYVDKLLSFYRKVLKK